jgi:Amt family ammonium transporter
MLPDRRGFVLHYQPTVSLGDRQLTGFEALVRRHHPGLLRALSRWALYEACRQMASWQRAIPREAPLKIGVNIPFRYLIDPGLIPDIQRILAETGLSPASLRLEMTERSVMAHGEAAKATLRCLRAMGIGLEIDDFGTGRASIDYLRRLPFDGLKIDRSFVKQIGAANDSSEIIGMILRFAGSLGMNAAAQGVETESQLERLTALGCRTAQGCYFSRPVDASGARALIEEAVRPHSIHLVELHRRQL